MEITDRWITIRVAEHDVRAVLHASASDGDKSATGSADLELPMALIKDLRGVITEHAAVVDDAAMEALHESRRIDRGGTPPAGVKAIKVGGGIGMQGDAARRKT